MQSLTNYLTVMRLDGILMMVLLWANKALFTKIDGSQIQFV